MNRYLLPSLIVGLIAMLASAQPPATREIPTTITPRVAGSGIWLGVGPDMKMLPAGAYRFVFIPADPNGGVTVSTMIIGGGTTPEPTPSNFREQLKTALAKLIDPTKNATATQIADALKSLVKSVDDGQIKEPAQLHQAVDLFATLLTAGKPDWQAVTTLVKDELGHYNTLPNCAATLRIVIEELEKIP